MYKLQLAVCLAVLALAPPQRTQAEDIGVVKLSDRTPQGKQVKSSGLIGRSSIQLATYLRQDEIPHPPVEGEVLPAPAPHAAYPQTVGPATPGQPCQQGQPCPHCKQVHVPTECEDSRGIPICCLPSVCCLPGVCCLGDCFCLGYCPHLFCCMNGHGADCECDECKKGYLKRCLDKCNGNGRFGYFMHDGYPCLDPLGHYGMVYPVNPQYFDKRDGQVYAAPHYGIPISVPLAPTVGKTYNYGWGIPSSRLTPVAHSYHWTYGGPVPSTHSTTYSPDYPYDHNYWVPPHDYYRKLPQVKVTAPPQRMVMAQQRLGHPTQTPITHGQPIPAQPAPIQPIPAPTPGAPVNLPPAP